MGLNQQSRDQDISFLVFPSLLESFRLVVSFQLEISFLSVRVLLWNCIRGLQYISSHPLVARGIECLELALASCIPCLDDAALSGAPPCRQGSGSQSYQFIYQFSSISPINPAPIYRAGDSDQISTISRTPSYHIVIFWSMGLLHATLLFKLFRLFN
jgi:hypothetical protein